MARKILLADDSVTAQNMGRKILTDAGYEVVAVNNGSAALKKIVEQKPDLIVLDVYMPGYSGLEVCQRIKENRETARIPVLLTVGKLEPFKPEEARRARADAFVVKPFEASELLTAITKLEEKIAPQPEPYKQGRFAKAVASLDETEGASGEKFGDSDSGWKSRIRFPGRKKQAEPEEAPEIPVSPKSARDLREAPVPAPPPAPAVPSFERPMPAGIPGDITPEEIAAISAAAARLSGTGTRDLVEPFTPNDFSAPPMPEVASVAAAPTIVEPQTIGIPDVSISNDIAPITFASSPVFAEEQPDGKLAEERLAQLPPAQSISAGQDAPPEKPSPEIAIPDPATPRMDSGEPAIESKVVSPEPALAAPEFTAPHASAAENEVPLVGVLQPSAVEQPVVAELPSVGSGPLPEHTEQTDSAATPEIHASAQNEALRAVSLAQSEPQPDVPATIVASAPESIAQPESPIASAAFAAPVPAHQDEEVMAALQNLIPTASSDLAVGSGKKEELPSGLVAAVAEFANAGIPVFRPRWIAEETVLTAEEAALSLEQEMEKAYAAFAATEAARLLATSAIESLAAQSTNTIGTALEHVPAPVAPLPSHNFAIADPAQQSAPPLALSDASPGVSAESETIHALASSAAAGEGNSISASIPVASAPFEIARDQQPPASSEQEQAESVLAVETHHQAAQPINPRPIVTDFVVAASSLPEAAPEAETAQASSGPVAFESGSNQNAISQSPESSNTNSYPPVPPETAEPYPASADTWQETISVGGIDSMAKNSESGLGFKMIRQSPAGSKATPTAPVTKENFDAPPAPATEPAAMAAAASAESVSAVPPMPATAPDPRAIASIVDSVLAELRPKIVEEIAKKLADPNK